MKIKARIIFKDGHTEETEVEAESATAATAILLKEREHQKDEIELFETEEDFI